MKKHQISKNPKRGEKREFQMRKTKLSFFSFVPSPEEKVFKEEPEFEPNDEEENCCC